MNDADVELLAVPGSVAPIVRWLAEAPLPLLELFVHWTDERKTIRSAHGLMTGRERNRAIRERELQEWRALLRSNAYTLEWCRTGMADWLARKPARPKRGRQPKGAE